ncbi:RNA polymerase sigma factor [Runella aurantiaca]|uniref:Sigma-70 family RNA polymerase sigma factor n=1 Tax=Runella aurantiaca TaxID=2282308 RepID=A0A369IBJ3_9BACT|nr:sigma-70 family RNA polymerase sigma factor [Runella aurantiaca]RDB04883.1 sigma-70 family RNA polymerase sigma factor [Runella aurantiaca]
MDLKAFTQLVLPTQGRLFRLAKLFLRNREEAEDTLQDVLLKLWTNRQQLESYQSVEAFAVQMTRNLCLDKLKSKAYQTTRGEVELHELGEESVSPYQQTEFADSAALMRQLIDALPEPQKLILHLRDVEEYTFEEIEQVTGLTVNNIRVILARARKEVRTGYLKVNNYEAGH